MGSMLWNQMLTVKVKTSGAEIGLYVISYTNILYLMQQVGTKNRTAVQYIIDYYMVI